MYFLGAMFVKEIPPQWCPTERSTREHNKRPLPLARLPILPLDERRVNGLHSDGYAWKIGGRLLDTHICIYRGGPENNTHSTRGDRGSACSNLQQVEQQSQTHNEQQNMALRSRTLFGKMSQYELRRWTPGIYAFRFYALDELAGSRIYTQFHTLPVCMLRGLAPK